MLLSDITTEMVARGAEVNTTRNEQWANLAYKEIFNAYDWPFSEAEVTGSAGAGTATVTDFRKAIIVSDKTTTPGRALDKILVPELVEDLGAEDLALTGTPSYWYLDGINNIITTFPKGGTVYVRYHKRAATITTAQTPVFSPEYHYLVVERAMVYVYKDNDELGNASQQLADYNIGLRQMARDYQVIGRAPSYIQATDPYDG